MRPPTLPTDPPGVDVSGPHRRLRVFLGVLTILVVGVALGVALLRPAPASAPASGPSHLVSDVGGSTSESPLPPSPPVTIGPGASAGPDLPVITYQRAPSGFPPDQNQGSTAPLTEGIHPTERIPAYDAPGGTPLAYLAPTISRVPVTMPIVERRADWTAVLLPSANRTIAWLAPGGGREVVALRDHLVVSLSAHTLTWYREGVPQRTWTVAVGLPQTPTPLGRTFILGRSKLSGSVYADVEVFALGAIPDNVDALPAGLRGAHTGIHTWHTTDTLGKDVTDGCVHLPQDAQRLLLSELLPGTGVVITT